MQSMPHVVVARLCGSAAGLVLALLTFACGGGSENPKECTRPSWQSMNVGADLRVRGVWGRRATDVWAAGDHGTLFHYDGRTWTSETVDGVTTLEALTGSDHDGVVYAAGWGAGDGPMPGASSRVFAHRQNGWNPMGGSLAGQVRGIFHFATGFVVAVGEDVNRGRIWRYEGDVWRSIDNPFIEVRAAFHDARQRLVAAGAIRSADDGTDAALYVLDGDVVTERHREPGARYLTAFSLEGGSAWIGGEDAEGSGAVWRVTSSGITQESIEAPGAVEAIHGASPYDLLAVSGTGIFARSGESWQLAHRADVPLEAVLSLGKDGAFATGARGTLFHRSCNAPTVVPPPTCEWNVAATLTSELVDYARTQSGEPVWALATGLARANGEQARTFWTSANIRLAALWESPSRALYAVGADFTDVPSRPLIVRCVGETCERMDTSVRGRLYAVHGFADDEVYAVGIDSAGCALALHYDGIAWTQQAGAGCASLNGIWGTSSAELWSVATVWNETDDPFGRIFRLRGETWEVAVARTPVGLTAVDGSSATNVYAIGADDSAPFASMEYGALLHYDGAAWSPLRLSNDVGYTSVDVAADGAIWLGALRWQAAARTSAIEIHRLRDGVEDVFTVCGARSPVAHIEASGASAIALAREGQVYRWTPN
jgi:hypothetical protein